MDKNEKKIVENLDYMTENIKVPDSLKPEAVEEMLKGHEVKVSEKLKNKKENVSLESSIFKCSGCGGSSAYAYRSGIED